jgi:ABC-2 type transport system ATP-binding protein
MGETVFAAINLKKKYKDSFALNGVDMEVKQKEVLGFVGENGAGKTTLFRILGGLITQTSGEISLWGKSGSAELVT